MGLIKAALASAGGVLGDQWKEYFYCDALPETVLAVRGKKKVSSRSSNKGNDNVITNGSVIAVADGQCMLIVDQGKVAEICAEPGEFVYDASTEPSVFSGALGQSVKDTFAAFHERFIRGHITLVGCPKLDSMDYSEKLKEIIRNNDIRSVTVVRMEVPCCSGLEMATKKALQQSGKFIPWQVVTVTVDGRLKEE